MSTSQKNVVAIYAMIANLAISGMTLKYVQDSEHRMTLLEAHVQQLMCVQLHQDCK